MTSLRGLPKALDRFFAGRGKAGSMAQVVLLRSMALAVNIATGLLTAAMLGPSGRGEQAALVVAPMFLGGIASLGLHGALIYNLKASPEQERELLGNGMMLTFGAGVIAAMIGMIVLPFWLVQYPPETVFTGRILLLATPMIVMSWSLSGAAESRGWFGLANHILYLQSIMTLVCLGVLALAGVLTPRLAATAYIGPMAPSFVFMAATISRRMHPIFRFRPDLAKRLLRYGIRLAGQDILGTVSVYIDQVVIVAILPPSTVGHYAVALSSARMLQVIQNGVGAVLFPSVAARSLSVIAETVASTFRIAVMIVFTVACGLSVVGPPLLVWAYGHDFAASVPPFHVLLFSMVVTCAASILYHGYTSSGRPARVTLFEVSGVATSTLFMFVLVPIFGPIGAALAVLCGASMRLLTAALGARSSFGLSGTALLPGVRDIRAIAAGIQRRTGHALPSERTELEAAP